MNEEKEKKEIDKKGEQELAKTIDELTEPVTKISDEELATTVGVKTLKANLQLFGRENRELKKKVNTIEEQNKELEKKVVVYEERIGWKNIISVFSAILLGISFILIQRGIQLEGLILIIVVIIINLIKLAPFRLPFRSSKKSEKI